MHILESYALQNDLKIDRPHLYEKFFPLAVDKYITLDTSSLGTSAMSYDHWKLVVNLISPILQKEGITIIQLGEKKCQPIEGCYIAIGQCDINHKSYVISKSLLHISSNNETSHIASSYNKPSVILYPYNCYIDQFRPYWSKGDEAKLIQGPQNNPRPSYNPNESPKSINSIKPEEVACEILDKLNLKYHGSFLSYYKTIKIGTAFHQPRIESSLTHLLDAQRLGVASLILRMDLNFNEEVLARQLEACPCSIISNRSISDHLIDKYSSKIIEFVYYLEDDNDPIFVKKLRSKSINTLLRSRKSEEEIQDLKLDYVDYGLIHKVPEKSKEDFSELKDKNKVYYNSNHFIIHNNKFYPSTASLVRGIQGRGSIKQEEPCEIIDDPIFWEEEEHFHLLEKK